MHFADLVNRDDFIHNVMAHVDPTRFAMSAATLHAGGTLNAHPGPFAVHDLGCRPRRRYPAAALRLRRLIARERVDVLHTHHYEPALIGLAATRGTGVPVVLGRHYSDAIYQLAHGWRRRAYLALESLSNRLARAIVAPSQAVAAVLLRQAVDPAKVHLIPYGFDFTRFGPRDPDAVSRARQAWPPGEGARLSTVARLHPEKGHRFLLAALASLKQEGHHARWLIVGDGPGRAGLEEQVRAHGLAASVRFAGWRTDVLDLLAASEVVVQPTLHEAFSQAMVEAMAMGRPLVISDVSGVRDVVEDGRSGLVVPPGDPAALANALRRLSDASLAHRLGEGAATRVRALLDIRGVARTFEALYERVAAAPRG